MQFKTFTEEYANFGFEILRAEDKKDNKEDAEGENPVRGLDLEKLTSIVAKYPLGERMPRQPFFDSVIWGRGSGSISLQFGTKFDVLIEQLSYDLQGNPVWVTRKILNLNKDYFSGVEEIIADELLKELKVVNTMVAESPDKKYKDLEKLVKNVAYRTSGTVCDPLYFEDICKVDDDEYIIRYFVRGSGVEAPDHRRVEQTQIHLKYHQSTGVIQMIQSNVESSMRSHTWEVMPSDFELYFMPTQSVDEISNSLSTIMKYF